MLALVKILGIFGSLYCITAKTITKPCRDIDQQVCHLFQNSVSNICEDTCFASLCQELCKKCPSKNEVMNALEKEDTATSSEEIHETNTCIDVSEQGCSRLSTLYPDMCSIPCIAKTCPTTCGECGYVAEDKKRQTTQPPSCYKCDNAQNSTGCDQTQDCKSADELCYTETLVLANGEVGYRFGCMHRNICTFFLTKGSHIFGKRSNSFELVIDGNCCAGDLCNNRSLSRYDAGFKPGQTLAPDACSDDPQVNCRFYNFNRTCDHNGRFAPWAKIHCRAHCGYCAAPTIAVPCVDYLPNCHEYDKDMCTREHFRIFREDNCRKFCGICKGKLDYVTTTHASINS